MWTLPSSPMKSTDFNVKKKKKKVWQIIPAHAVYFGNMQNIYSPPHVHSGFNHF